MKICWDTLNGMFLTKEGNLKKFDTIYIEKTSCVICKDPYLMRKRKPSPFCSRRCANLGENNPQFGKIVSENTRKKLSIISSGRNNRHWKGGVTKLNLPLFDTYASQLDFAEEVRSYLDEEDRKLLEVRCTKCNKWFIPNICSVHNRVCGLNGTGTGECRFYCSKKCKEGCIVFRKHPEYYLDIHKNKSNYYTDNELKIWSQEVLSRVNYECEICGKPAEHAHHIQPKKLEPGLALDPDNGLAFCKDCHARFGHTEGCSNVVLARTICKR